MDEKSPVGINGSDGGLTAGVASWNSLKTSWMHIVLFLLPYASVGAARYFSCTHERLLRKEKTIRKSDWINTPPTACVS